MIAVFLVSTGAFIIILLLSNSRGRIPRWLNIIGAILVGIAILVFVYKYTYLGWTIREGLIFSSQKPCQMQEFDCSFRAGD